MAAAPVRFNQLLGALGILGAVGLLAAFVVEIDPSLNGLRILAFNAGSMAIVFAAYPRQSSRGRRVALLGTVPALIGNGFYLLMTVLSAGREHPFAGDFGFVYFLSSIALWLGDAAFGLATLRLGVFQPSAALALAVGSVLGTTGIDRLGLTSSANPTIFGPIALVGLALNGIGWIILGIEVVRGSD